MAESKELREVLGDYARFVRALIPQSVGVLCHDERGTLLWHDEYSPDIQLTPDFDSAIGTLIKSNASPGLHATVAVTAPPLIWSAPERQRWKNGDGSLALSAILDESATTGCAALM